MKSKRYDLGEYVSKVNKLVTEEEHPIWGSKYIDIIHLSREVYYKTGDRLTLEIGLDALVSAFTEGIPENVIVRGLSQRDLDFIRNFEKLKDYTIGTHLKKREFNLEKYNGFIDDLKLVDYDRNHLIARYAKEKREGFTGAWVRKYIEISTDIEYQRGIKPRRFSFLSFLRR